MVPWVIPVARALWSGYRAGRVLSGASLLGRRAGFRGVRDRRAQNFVRKSVRKLLSKKKSASGAAVAGSAMGYKRAATFAPSTPPKRPRRRRTPWRRPAYLKRRRTFRRHRRFYMRFRRRFLGRNRAESKKIYCLAKNQIAPTVTKIPYVTALGVSLGAGTPTAWTPPAAGNYIQPIEGMETLQGTSALDRIGSKTFMKHTTLRLNVVMNYVQSSTDPPRYPTLPVEFRCIVLKARQSGGPQTAGTSAQLVPDPFKNLFRRINGTDFYGPETPAAQFWPSPGVASGSDNNFMNTSIFSRALVNKSHFKVYKDFKFVLGPPVVKDGAEEHPNIPIHNCHKTIQFKLKHNRRAEHGVTATGETTPRQPRNFDWRYVVLLFAYWQNAQSPGDATLTPGPTNWVANWSGLTTFTDA